MQRATADQLEAQAGAAHAAFDEMRAQPRPEALAVASAQTSVAEATYKMNKDTFDKLEGIALKDPGLVNPDQLDNAANALRVAAAGPAVANRQYEFTKACTWRYDLIIQEQQYVALDKANRAAMAQLAKYTIRAPVDGNILAVQTSVGAYASAKGTYGTVSGRNSPVLMGGGPMVN